MMKKLLVLCAALAMIFAFTMPAAAHEACCEDCPKCDIGTIRCPVSSTAVNSTGDCTAYWFDYDDTSSDPSATALATGARGYTTQNAGCKVLFDICCCSDVSAFVSDNTIGIRMTSLTDGFYFTSDEIFFTTYDSRTEACEDPYMSDGGQDGVLRTFGTEYLYWADIARTASTNPADKDDDCALNYRPRVKETECGLGYLLLDTDIDDAFCWWWIDMPAMKYDKDIAVRGSSVRVKIELIAEGEPGTICDECEVICECIVDLGIYCPEAEPCPTECCVLFPYVLTKDQPLDSAWSTGITLINLNPASVTAEDMEISFELVDVNGHVFTYTKDDFASGDYVWTFTLDNGPFGILSNFVGSYTMALGRCYLKATANFMIHGYMFLSNGSYAGGTYATDCCSPCSCSARK